MASLADIALVISSAVAVVVCILLLVLVTRTSSHDLRIYKRYMAFSACVDLGLALSNIVSVPQYIAAVNPGEAAIVAHGVVGYAGSPYLTHITFVLHVMFNQLTLYGLSWAFIYRYAVLCDTKWKRLILWRAMPLYCIAQFAYTVPDIAMFFVTFDSSLALKTKLSDSSYGATPDAAFIYYRDALIGRWGLTGAMVVNAVGYLTIFVCGFASVVTLRRQRARMNTYTYRLHKQYTRILLIQAIVPCVSYVIPAILHIMPQFAGIPGISSFRHIAVVLGSTHPATEPLIYILLVRQFRASLCSVCLKHIVVRVATSGVGPSDSRPSPRTT
ncbi:7TM GPCR protein [Aphelenchoides avenae]|nr:7TM GPCR protein [Aphelenchus avenae]